MIKSVIRLGACVLLGYSFIQQVAFAFAFAEMLGIIEEL